MASQGMQSRHRVLLVEDHDLVAEAIARFMDAHGLEVRVASTGHEALDATPAFQPEIVLCDLRLPDMDGLDVARALRAIPRGANLVIALHTAMSGVSPGPLDGPNSALVDRIVPKPITQATLADLISLVENRASRTSGA